MITEWSWFIVSSVDGTSRLQKAEGMASNLDLNIPSVRIYGKKLKISILFIHYSKNLFNLHVYQMFENRKTTNLAQMAEGSINSTNNGSEYSIPYLRVH